MRACLLQGLQPRGGSDAEADFAEQVNVWILECPLEAAGARGPKASFANTPRAPKRRAAARGASKIFWILRVWVKENME